MALPRAAAIRIVYSGDKEKSKSSSGVSSSKKGSGNSGSSSSSTGTKKYTVAPGDTLWGISKKFLGDGNRYMEIYNPNKEIIESTAKAHGKASSYKGNTAGWWIWPGEVFIIPGQTVTEEKKAAKTAKTSEKSKTTTMTLGERIASQASAFTYTDIASGQSDSVSITMHDVGKAWLKKYMPKKGAEIKARIVLKRWDKEKSFTCGYFTLDDISFSGRPLSCVLGGVSVPVNDDFKSFQRSKTYEKTTVKDIAQQIAKRAGVNLFYDAPNIQIAEKEQSKQTDSAFLYSICADYGLAMKVYSKKIVIFDITEAEKKKPVRTIKEKQILSWNYNTTIDGTYTGVKLEYTNPDSDKKISVTLGEKGRMYGMNTQASSQYDAELMAAAKVNEANRSIETMEVTMLADTDICASQCVKIKDFGKISGKYYIDKIMHNLGGSGYTMTLSMHKVQKPIKAK